VATVVVAGKSVCAPTTPVVLGDKELSTKGWELYAVYTLPGLEATTITPRAYRVPGTRVYVAG
jgi:hypothetical protein